MNHLALCSCWLALDSIVCLAFTVVLRAPPTTSWSWIALVWALKLSSDIPILRTGHGSVWLDAAGTLLYLILCFLGGSGLGKRLWGKLKSAALTAVNQASFQQQQREAFQ